MTELEELMAEVEDLACPYCGQQTIYKPEGWVEGGVLRCSNPSCDSNHPPEA